MYRELREPIEETLLTEMLLNASRYGTIAKVSDKTKLSRRTIQYALKEGIATPSNLKLLKQYLTTKK